MSRENEIYSNIIVSPGSENDMDFIPLITDEEEDSLKQAPTPDVVPVLPLRNTVLFPGVILPITVTREKSRKLVRDENADNPMLGAMAQLETIEEDPT